MITGVPAITIDTSGLDSLTTSVIQQVCDQAKRNDDAVIQGMAAPAWTAIVNFLNGWGAGAVAPQYKLDAFGVMWFRGSLAGGAIGQAAFTIPNPPTAVVRKSVSSNLAFGELVIDAVGNVVPNIGSNVSFSIDCDFRVD